MIYKAHNDQKPPVYGQGINVRDWLYVEDHCRGILAVLEKGKVGEVYNLGGHNERNNLYIVKRILSELGKPESLIEFVADRHGHDQRYAIDPHKANVELGWDPITTFEVGIKKTIEWYLSEKGSQWLEECMAQNAAWLEKEQKVKTIPFPNAFGQAIEADEHSPSDLDKAGRGELLLENDSIVS